MTLHASLHQLRARFRGIRPWPGLFRSVIHFLLTYIPVAYCVATPIDGLWFVVAVAAGVLYASLLVLTHDGLHFTLTGWRVFDNVFSRLVSYPILWPHATYGELHRIHHKFNGNNPQDPENVMATRVQWEKGSRLGQFYRRHQWGINLFVSGGLGLIAHHWMVAFRLREGRPKLVRAMRTDFWCILIWYSVMTWLLISQGIFLRWFVLFWFMERIIGFVHQLRSQVEHYGEWHPHKDPLETQLFSARNTRTHWLVSQFMNGLNFHSVHHAFPTIPFYKLSRTHEALLKVCAEHNATLHFGDGYLKTAWRESRQVRLIEREGEGADSNGHQTYAQCALGIDF